MFETINRDVLILFPKQPLYDWSNSIFQNDKLECKEALAHDEGNVYLIHEFIHYSDAIEFLKENFTIFFEQELLEWTPDEELWPEKLTWELFETWFHYSIQSMVMDTLNKGIVKGYL